MLLLLSHKIHALQQLLSRALAASRPLSTPLTFLPPSPRRAPQMWQAGRHDWKLLRVGVVDLRNDVFVARLFFGDPATGEVMWDCDCRPSDATFLAMKVRGRRGRLCACDLCL